MSNSQEDYILLGIVRHDTLNADVVYVIIFYYLNGLDETIFFPYI